MIPMDDQNSVEDSFDIEKPRILDITNYGDDIGQFIWDGKVVTMKMFSREPQDKVMMHNIFNGVEFYNTYTDGYCHDDGKNDILAFTSKVEGMSLKYGFRMENIEGD